MTTLYYLLSEQDVISEQGGRIFSFSTWKKEQGGAKIFLVHEKKVQGGAKPSK